MEKIGTILDTGIEADDKRYIKEYYVKWRFNGYWKNVESDIGAIKAISGKIKLNTDIVLQQVHPPKRK